MGPYILTVILAAVIALYLFLRARGVKAEREIRENQRWMERQKYARWGRAVIIRADGGIAGEGAEEMVSELTLDVFPPEGEPYRASTTWKVEVTSIGAIQQGREIPVKIDEQDHKIIYPYAAWAEYVRQ